MKNIAADTRAGKSDLLHANPMHTPRRRLDEVTAARNPVLTWKN
jgi:glycine dehydrogenase subunit 2